MTFDPDTYTITIRKEALDGEVCYVGKVAEFQNVTACEDSYEKALATIRDVLTTIAKIAERQGQALPAPQQDAGEIPSGRITLRMPRSLHAKVLRRAEQDDTSANQVINIAITEYVTGMDITSKVAEVMFNAVKDHMQMKTYVTKDSFSFDMDDIGIWQGTHHTAGKAQVRTSHAKRTRYQGRKPS